MLFNSLSFAVFLPIVFVLYWLLPHRYRWVLLLIASYYFYMSWNVKYVVLILFTTVVSYVAARKIEKANTRTKRMILLVATLVASLGVLFFFKYFNFVSNSIIDFLNIFALHLNPLTLKLLLPVGISFYTFQTLSYVIDVYRGDVEAEQHFGEYATFISFFPQLVAGPIERSMNLLPQIKKEHFFEYKNATYGLKLMAWGFFKKMVIADTLAVSVDAIYNSIYGYQGFSLILATVFFAIQIYCDFSGYSDIAIGASKLFGIELMTNFKTPYFSASIKEFWSRWHISLSTWFRDYVYIPLGGNRVGKVRQNVNLFATFLISGLWHGANWTYVVWGAIHGLAQIVENLILGKTQKKKTGLRWLISVILVFVFCCFSWIFFRAENLTEAMYVVRHVLDGVNDPLRYIQSGLTDLDFGKTDFVVLILSIGPLLIYDFASLKIDVISSVGKRPLLVRWLLYIGIIWLVIILTPITRGNEFIYFQF